MKSNKLLVSALLILCALVLTGCANNSAMNNNMNWPAMTVEDDTLYTASGPRLEAVRDGKKVWSYPKEDPGRNAPTFYAEPGFDDSFVFAGTYNNQLYVLSKTDGSLVSQIEVGGNKNKILAAPVAAENSLIVISSGGMMSSYPITASGVSTEANWQTTLSGELWIKPVCVDGTIYAPSLDKKMNLVDLKTGEVKQVISMSGAVMSDMVLQDGKLYFTTIDKEVNVMDLKSGEIHPLLTTDNEIWASPLLMNNKVIAADMAGYVYIADIESGKIEWKSEKLTSDKIGFIAAPIALDDETFIVIDETGKAQTFDLDGKSIQQRVLELPVYTTPISLGSGSIAVMPMSGDGQIRAFTADLKEDWVYTQTDEPGSAEPTQAAAEQSETAQPETEQPTAQPEQEQAEPEKGA